MSAITSVMLRNFRGFKKPDELRLAPLTFLVGPNSSGKSSIADALLFMAQSDFLSLAGTTPNWTGPLVDLGSFKDTVYRHDTKRLVEISVGLDLTDLVAAARGTPQTTNVTISAQMRAAKDVPAGRLGRLSLTRTSSREGVELVRGVGRYETFRARAGTREVPLAGPRRPFATPGDAFLRVLWSGKGPGKERKLISLLDSGLFDFFSGSLQRVSSGRAAPFRSYQRATGGPVDRRVLYDVHTAALEPSRSKANRDLRARLTEGLLALGIADTLEASPVSDYHTNVTLTDSVTGVTSNLADFGYGASQVLPVLEGCAARGPGPLFIEQPEIHLPPRAQGQLAQIVCDASKRRQMIVETHSEHMINRARLLVAEGHMKASDVVIQYIDRDEEGSHATAITLDARGDFNAHWPNGFFDERYDETMRIAQAQAMRADK